jgi:hypothetical protein
MVCVMAYGQVACDPIIAFTYFEFLLIFFFAFIFGYFLGISIAQFYNWWFNKKYKVVKIAKTKS